MPYRAIDSERLGNSHSSRSSLPAKLPRRRAFAKPPRECAPREEPRLGCAFRYPHSSPTPIALSRRGKKGLRLAAAPTANHTWACARLCAKAPGRCGLMLAVAPPCPQERRLPAKITTATTPSEYCQEPGSRFRQEILRLGQGRVQASHVRGTSLPTFGGCENRPMAGPSNKRRRRERRVGWI